MLDRLFGVELAPRAVRVFDRGGRVVHTAVDDLQIDRAAQMRFEFGLELVDVRTIAELRHRDAQFERRTVNADQLAAKRELARKSAQR